MFGDKNIRFMRAIAIRRSKQSEFSEVLVDLTCTLHRHHYDAVEMHYIGL